MSNKLSKSVIVIYFLALFFYFIQGGIYGHGTIIPTISLLYVLAINSFCLSKFLQQYKKTSHESTIAFFLFIVVFSFIFSPKVVHVISFSDGVVPIKTFGEFKNIYLVLSTYFSFAYWARKGLLDSTFLQYSSILIIVAFVWAYYIKLEETLILEYWTEDVTNNAGYFLPSIFPLAGLFIRKKISWIFFGVALLLSVLSAKRGAIICMLIEGITFLYYQVHGKINAKKVFLILFVVVIGFFFLYNLYLNNDFLQNRFNSDSSGRNRIYSKSIELFVDGSIFQQFFGRGFYQTLEAIKIYAHSDWLEILVDIGVLGFFSYLALFVRTFLFGKKNKKFMHPEIRFMFVTSLFCFFVKSLFSMSFNAPESCVLMLALAVSSNYKFIKL